MSIYKICFSVVLLLLGLSVGFSQNSTSINNYLLSDSLNLNKNSTELIKSNKKKIHYGLEVGTSFASNGAGTYSYVAPFVLFPITNKISIDLGVRMSTGSMFYGYDPYFNEQNNTIGNSLRQNTFFVRGRYNVNPNLIIFGSGYYQKNFLFSNNETSNLNLDRKAMSLGFEYKISNSTSFQFEFQTGNMYNTYRNDNMFFPSQTMFPQRFIR